MTVQRIREAILSEAREEAGRILSEARARHDRRLQAACSSLDSELEQRLERAQQEAQQESQRQIMRARGRHNLALLQRRNTILDELFRQAAERLVGLTDEQYCAVVEGWMRQVPAHQPGDVLCTEPDGERLAPLIEKLDASRAADAQLRLVPAERPTLGGVIFRTDKFEIDLSVDTRIAQLRQELAPQVAGIIFPTDIRV